MENRMTILKICVVILIFFVFIESKFIEYHTPVWWRGIVGVNISIAAFGSLFLTWFAKGFGKNIVQRDEDYWDGGGDK
ncbi:MAG: hypothetical protein GX318_09075 [Clostridia bacterium]|nr:hypothetical protein [Clostridia bacterium]